MFLYRTLTVFSIALGLFLFFYKANILLRFPLEKNITVSTYSKNNVISPSEIAMKNRTTRKSKKAKVLQSKWLKYLATDPLSETYKPQFKESRILLCDSSVQIVLVIFSAPENKANRICIRKTFGFYKVLPELKIVFLVGKSKDQNVDQAFHRENLEFKDMVRINIQESYNNLPYKAVAMLELLTKQCKSAKFLLKLDDDIFVNVPKLLMFPVNHKNDKRKVYGNLFESYKPVRDKGSNFFVSKDEYSGDVYPNYMHSPSYLMTTDILPELYNTSLDTPFFKFEDIFLTGLVAQQLKIDLVNDDGFNRKPDNATLKNMDKGITLCAYNGCDDIFRIWEKQFAYYKNRGILI